MTEYLVSQLTASAVGWVAGALTTWILIHKHKENHR